MVGMGAQQVGFSGRAPWAQRPSSSSNQTREIFCSRSPCFRSPVPPLSPSFSLALEPTRRDSVFPAVPELVPFPSHPPPHSRDKRAGPFATPPSRPSWQRSHTIGERF